MINPWFRSYLVLTLLGLDLAESAFRFWQNAVLAGGSMQPPALADAWLSAVEPGPARWARSTMVYNCAAAAYTRDATDLSRLRPANDGIWREGPRRRAR